MVTLCVDIMHVNKVMFLITISKHAHYGTATAIPNDEMVTIVLVLKNLIKFYAKREFKVTMIIGDGQFQPLENLLEGVAIKISSAEECVGEIE